MKTRYKISSVLAIVLLTSVAVHAQNFKTTESVSKQLRQGTVPGLQYGPTKSQNGERSKTVQNSKLSFREKTFTGGVPKSTGPKTFSQARINKTSQKPTPSETAAPVNTQKKPVAPKMPPMQGTEKVN